MNKKAIFILLVAVVAAGLVLSGCGKKENPFAPTTASIPGTVGAMASQGPHVTSMSTLDGNNTLYHTPTFDEIEILFNKDIAPGTVNTSTIRLQRTGNLSEAITYTVTYDAGTKRAYLRVPAGWNDVYAYLVTVTTGVRDLNGNALDGNANAFIDPQDHYREVFIGGGTVTDPGYDLTGPTAVVYPGDNQTNFLLSDSIYVYINETAGDSIDPTTLVNANFRLTNESGVAVTLPALHWTETVTPQRQYRVAFTGLGLTAASNYYLTVTTGIKDTKGNSLDGNGNGSSEAESIDREIVKFRTYETGNGPLPSLKVVSATLVDANQNLSIRFNRKMNPATLSTGTIKLFNNSDKTGFILGTIRLHPDTMGVNYSLENWPGGTNYLWVSCNVQSAAGYKLDQNANNIAGEPSWTVVNGTAKPSDDLWATIAYNAGLRYILWDDNAEGTPQGISAQRMWHRSTRRAANGLYSWHCGNDADSSYRVGGVATVVHDTLFFPALDLTGWGNVRIAYRRWYITDGGADVISLISSVNNGTSWATVNTWSGSDGTWVNTSITMTATNQVTRYALAFDTDAAGNAYPSEGPYWDNIYFEVW